jgi:anti-sigma28 factor (negative regulator of flagellin synthesis)
MTRGSTLMKTMREKAADARVTKLELVREQIENGSLVIRQMTDAERALYPPRPSKPKRC